MGKVRASRPEFTSRPSNRQGIRCDAYCKCLPHIPFQQYHRIDSFHVTRVLTVKCIVPEKGDRPVTTEIWNYMYHQLEDIRNSWEANHGAVHRTYDMPYKISITNTVHSRNQYLTWARSPSAIKCSSRRHSPISPPARWARSGRPNQS